MNYKFGDVVIDPTDSRCISLLGKMVLASMSGKMISKVPNMCAMGTLKEVDVNSIDKPFTVETKDGIILTYRFIREIVKA